MKKNNYLFMAFAKGMATSDEASEIKRYIGVAPVWVLAANPSKDELEKIYNRSLENAPEYNGEQDGVKTARVDFIVKTDAEKCDGIEIINKVSFFVRDEFRFNKDKTKVQVIDKYGRTAWATKEECEAHSTMLTKNDGTKYQANIDSDYRPCYVGEEDLTNFIKVYLGIPNVQAYIDGKWVPNPKVTPEECEARLNKIKEMFSGNFSEIKEIPSYQPNNKIKVLFGVKTNNDGKQFQTVYNQMVLRSSVSDYSKLDAEIKDRKNNGAFPTTDYEVCPIKEYKVEATPIDAVGDLPVNGTDSWFK